MNRPNARGENGSAAVRNVVPVDGRDDRVVQAEVVDRLRQADWFEEIELPRATRSHRAIPARARADGAQDHECRLARLEALADVRAMGLFAHRVERLLAQQALDLPIP